MNQQDYFSILKASLPLRGKHVLEIGGAAPPSLIASGRVGSWTAIDISPQRFTESHGKEEIPHWYNALLMDATSMTFPNASFDIVYSTNCFEHILDIPSALRDIYRVLKPGGVLYSIFAPIWSAPDGHHTWVWDGDTPVTFSQDLFQDWLHLVFSEEELRKHLNSKYKPQLVESIVNSVYRGTGINRVIDADYEQEIEKYGYTPIVNLRIRSRKKPTADLLKRLRTQYPRVRDFRTEGYFWVLVKGRCRLRTRFRVYCLGLSEVAWRKAVSRIRPELGSEPEG